MSLKNVYVFLGMLISMLIGMLFVFYPYEETSINNEIDVTDVTEENIQHFSQQINHEIDERLPYELLEKKCEIIDDTTHTDIQIVYPQLMCKSRNASVCEQFANILIEQTAREILEDFQGLDTYISMDYNVSLATDKVISVQFFGDAYIWGTAHPSQFWKAINIDLTKGSRISLDALYEYTIKDYINSDNFTFSYGAIVPYTDNVELLLADYANNSYHVNDFYLTEDKIGIALEVNFASGGYVQYEAGYQLLKACQKESDIWTFIQK